MILNKWEIWHTFSTYFISTTLKLDSLAELFVKSSFADFVLHKDGLCFWKSNKNDYQKGFLKYDLSDDRRNATYELKSISQEEISITDYASEMLSIATSFKFSEIRLFGDEREFPCAYIRAFLSPCRLIHEEWGIVETYPVITLYDNGILLVHFRLISPDQPIDLELFVKKYVNLFQNRFEKVDVPLTIASLAPIAYYFYNKRFLTPFSRILTLYGQKLHNNELSKLIINDDSGDFNFVFAPLTSEKKSGETITSLAQTVFSIVGYLISEPHRRYKFLILGKNSLPELGNYWMGRPHIHILSHKNQAETASENEKRHKDSFGWILARNIGSKDEKGSRFLPLDLRMFEDFQSYVTSAASLWVWSKRGLSNQDEWKDPNSGHLIYEHQMQAEILDYGCMLHRSLLEYSESLSNLTDVLKIKKYINFLKMTMKEASYYGELRELLITAWKSMGVENIREQIDENLKILEAETKYIESRRNDQFRIWLTILFGFFAIPKFAESVLTPLWYFLKLPYPIDPNWTKLYFILLSSIIISIIICIFYLFKFSKNKQI